MSKPSTSISPATLITLGLLAAAAPLSTDLYLAAFPAMTADLQTTAVGVQMSLTTFLIGAGLGQVLFGPWSDRVGRMKPLVIGLAVYVVASVAAALAPTVAVLVIARLIQGIGGSAGMVIGRAMILDRHSGVGAAKALNVMMAMTGIAPVLAPLLGALLTEPLGWRGLLWILVGLAVLALISTLAVLRESLPRDERDRRRADHQPGAWRSLLTVPYLGGVLGFAFAMGVLMAYISASPFVYQEILGFGEITYGLCFAVNALGMVAATAVSSRLSARYSLRGLAGAGLAVSGLGVVAVLVCALLGAGAGPLLVALFVAVAPLGLVLGNVSALTLAAVSPRVVGLASAVLGLMQFVLAGTVAALVGLGGEDTAVPMAAIMLGCAVLSAIALIAVGRSRPLETEVVETGVVETGVAETGSKRVETGRMEKSDDLIASV